MILFYGTKDKYGPFSNFSRHRVRIYERTWMTSEHAFQAAKFKDSDQDHMETIAKASTPASAKELGRSRSHPMGPRWEKSARDSLSALEGFDYSKVQFEDEVRRPTPPEPVLHRLKDFVMYEVVYAKFEQHRELKELLLNTLDETIVEDTTSSGDAYWGWGRNHHGENKLGRILMAVRYGLRTMTGRPLDLNVT